MDGYGKKGRRRLGKSRVIDFAYFPEVGTFEFISNVVSARLRPITALPDKQDNIKRDIFRSVLLMEANFRIRITFICVYVKNIKI